MIFSEEVYKKNSHIPEIEIKQDIEDTKREIAQYELELKILTQNIAENKVDIYVREGKILARKSFIEKLETLLKYRKDKNELI